MMTSTCDSQVQVQFQSEVADVVRRAARVPAGIPIHADSHLVDDLRIDSLDFVAVVLQLQDHFEVVIEDDAVPKLCRIADLASYLVERREALRS